MNYLIPNYIVRGGKNNITLINKMLINNTITDSDSDKVLLVFKYLFENTTNANTINFTLEDLINNCGFVARVETNKVFKNILDYLHKNNYIIADDIDFTKVKPKEFIKVGIDYFEINNKGNKINYFMLDDEEIEDIYNIDNVDNGKLLLYYSTLKSRIYTNNHESDEKPQVCYIAVEDMSKDISLSSDTINNYNNILVDNDLIYIDNAGKFMKVGGKEYTQSVNTYTLTSIKNYKGEVDKSINIYKNYMKDLGWIQCKEPTMTKRQVAGAINRLVYLEKEGKLTDEGKAQLVQLQEQQNIISNTAKFDNKQLLEDNPNMLLSDIFADMEVYNLSERYGNIELDLGLVDEDFNLLVDKKYYDWVITEYDVKEHDKYKNYVAKKIKEQKADKKDDAKGYFGVPRFNRRGVFVEDLKSANDDKGSDSIDNRNNSIDINKIAIQYAIENNYNVDSIYTLVDDIEDYLQSEDFKELSKVEQEEQLINTFNANKFDFVSVNESVF